MAYVLQKNALISQEVLPLIIFQRCEIYTKLVLDQPNSFSTDQHKMIQIQPEGGTHK